jgi:hypothetical protein
MRPASNLKSNPDFQVKKSDLRQGFLAAYNTRLGMNTYEFVYKLVMAALYPAANKAGAPETKLMRAFAEANVSDDKRKWAIRSTLRFDAPTRSFEFRTPLYRAIAIQGDASPPAALAMAIRDALKSSMSYMQITDLLNTPVSLANTPMGGGRILSGAELSTQMQVPSATKSIVAECIKHVEAEQVGSNLVLWVTFRIDQTEAEYLNNTPANMIKLGNFYPTLLDWAATVMGEEGNIPKTITPIATISKSVKEVLSGANVKPRVGIEDMVMDIQNNLLVIPVVDNSAEYEQKLMDFGLREHGVYTWAGGAVDNPGDDPTVFTVGQGVDTRPKLPINMPIFTDWLNDKFAYSNTAGNLAVYDLSNTVPVTNFHMLKVLDTPATPELKGFMKVINNAVNNAARYDSQLFNQRPTHQDIAELRTVSGVEVSPDALSAFDRPATTLKMLLERGIAFHNATVGNTSAFFIDGNIPAPRLWQLHHQSGLPTLRFIGRVLKKTLEMVESNMEAMYRFYSVMTVLQQLAVLRIAVKHSHRHAEITSADAAERDPYLNQAPDPAYKVGPIALVRKDLKFMPHQGKIDNMMRKHPKSAVYGVAAGGGKTILILTNVLREIKAGVCKKPIIMCPPHLVAQYIEEVVYVTEGRLNIIPVTNVSFKSHGEDALRKMIENAPPNTIVLTDYDFVKGRAEDLSYGNKAVTIYRNAEFLRTFEFDLVAMDESHFLKNSSSIRRDATARLIQDIPYKRLASGTFIADTPKDVVSQIALIDPTIFGSEENFKAEFSEEMRGGKVIAWKEGYERTVRERINDHVVFAEGKRKEWAALLPTSNENFYGVELSENQRTLYDSILAETMALINEALARLERFLSAPDQDPAGAIFLKDAADHVSPKLAKMYELIQGHLDAGLPGKILVFTMYLPTAEAAYLNAPPALRAQGIHYVAEEKEQARSDFEKNDEKRWMVGQSSSMDTGLNFQHVSRLIRLETVWTPGVLEQGNSRINRPQLKSEEKRKQIFFDWIMVNKTVDITKVSRLISKIISKAKFDEYDNPAYQNLDPLDPVAITLESIAEANDFETNLEPYLLGYQEYSNVRDDDYAQYKVDNGDKLDPVAVPQGGMLEGSKLMSRVPYVPGMNVYGASQLGLLRYDQFVRQDIDTVDDADVEVEDDEEDEGPIGEDGLPTDPKAAVRRAQRELRAKERVLVKHQPCHTEYGDGEITAIGNKFVRIRLNNGQRARLEKLKVFIITRGQTNGIDMRNELLRQVGDIPVDTPITVPLEPGPAVKLKKGVKPKEVLEPTAMQAAFDFTLINDMLFVKYTANSTDDVALPILQNLGFRVSPQYKFARMANHRQLLRLFKAWSLKGFKIDKHVSAVFKQVFEMFKVNPKNISKFGFSTDMQFKNFYREEIKPSANPQDIKVYPMIQDGLLYVILPTAGQTGNLKAARVTVPNITWRVGGGHEEILAHVKTKQEGQELLKKVISAGIEITNKDDLYEQYKKIRMGKKV